MKELIAIIEDEPDISRLVAYHLKKANFNVREFRSSKNFLTFLEDYTPDLIILDLMLPDADGFDICKDLKSNDRYSTVPIIMLTAKSEEIDKILGLELGADDYITKPFSPRELVSRVKAVLRRISNKPVPTKNIVCDILEIDLQKFEVAVEGKKIDLTSTEFKILKVLISHKGWVFSREQILDEIWGSEKVVLDRTVDVHIKNLREKLGNAGKFIKNIRGVGYKLEE